MRLTFIILQGLQMFQARPAEPEQPKKSEKKITPLLAQENTLLAKPLALHAKDTPQQGLSHYRPTPFSLTNPPAAPSSFVETLHPLALRLRKSSETVSNSNTSPQDTQRLAYKKVLKANNREMQNSDWTDSRLFQMLSPFEKGVAKNNSLYTIDSSAARVKRNTEHQSTALAEQADIPSATRMQTLGSNINALFTELFDYSKNLSRTTFNNVLSHFIGLFLTPEDDTTQIPAFLLGLTQSLTPESSLRFYLHHLLRRPEPWNGTADFITDTGRLNSTLFLNWFESKTHRRLDTELKEKFTIGVELGNLLTADQLTTGNYQIIAQAYALATTLLASNRPPHGNAAQPAILDEKILDLKEALDNDPYIHQHQAFAAYREVFAFARAHAIDRDVQVNALTPLYAQYARLMQTSPHAFLLSSDLAKKILALEKSISLYEDAIFQYGLKANNKDSDAAFITRYAGEPQISRADFMRLPFLKIASRTRNDSHQTYNDLPILKLTVDDETDIKNLAEGLEAFAYYLTSSTSAPAVYLIKVNDLGTHETFTLHPTSHATSPTKYELKVNGQALSYEDAFTGIGSLFEKLDAKNSAKFLYHFLDTGKIDQRVLTHLYPESNAISSEARNQALKTFKDSLCAWAIWVNILGEQKNNGSGVALRRVLQVYAYDRSQMGADLALTSLRLALENSVESAPKLEEILHPQKSFLGALYVTPPRWTDVIPEIAQAQIEHKNFKECTCKGTSFSIARETLAENSHPGTAPLPLTRYKRNPDLISTNFAYPDEINCPKYKDHFRKALAADNALTQFKFLGARQIYKAVRDKIRAQEITVEGDSISRAEDLKEGLAKYQKERKGKRINDEKSEASIKFEDDLLAYEKKMKFNKKQELRSMPT